MNTQRLNEQHTTDCIDTTSILIIWTIQQQHTTKSLTKTDL